MNPVLVPHQQRHMCFIFVTRCTAKPDVAHLVIPSPPILIIAYFLIAGPVNPSFVNLTLILGGSEAEWLACWTHAQKGRVEIAAAMLSRNSLRQAVHTHRASVHQAAKLVAALLRVAGATAGLTESNGSLLPGL